MMFVGQNLSFEVEEESQRERERERERETQMMGEKREGERRERKC